MNDLPMNIRMNVFLARYGLSESSLYGETQYWMVYSALNRQDYTCAETYLRDWRLIGPAPKKQMQITKFVPGDHYHVLGHKFEDFGHALDYLKAKGYEYAGLKETFVYSNQSE